MTVYLKVVYDDGVGDAVGIQVLHHRVHAGEGHSDVDGELSGDGVEPEVQLESDRKVRPKQLNIKDLNGLYLTEETCVYVCVSVCVPPTPVEPPETAAVVAAPETAH